MKQHRHRVRSLIALVAVLAALFPGAGQRVLPVAAQATDSVPPEAVSADPAEEIVFIDNQGFIRIIDTSGTPSLNGWSSPEGGWEDLRLADVDADGDLEILAFGRVGGNTKIVVYDPVVASGGSLDPNKQFNGIPWDQLFRDEFPGRGNFIIGGDFDDAIPGDEFAVGYWVDSNLFSILIWKAASLQPNGRPSGRDWTIHISKQYDYEYENAASGQVNGVGAEELIVVGKRVIPNATGSDTETFFDVLDADNNLERIDGKASTNATWEKVAIGEVAGGDGGREEVVAIRSGGGNLTSILVYQWDTGDRELTTEEQWQTKLPQPSFVFLADFFGDGDKEVVTIHNSRPDVPELRTWDCCGPNRNIFGDRDEDGNSGAGPTAELDENNAYRRGIGGDIDGDGKDEILVIRDNNIRVFTEPSSGLGSGTIQDFGVVTNRESIQVGDLDKNGFISGPQFGVDRSMIVAQAPVGTVSGLYTIRLSNISTNETPNYFIVGGYPSWVQIENPSGQFGPGGTPIRFRFNATNLRVGTYNATIQISSPADVVNKPYNIQVTFTVQPAVLTYTGATTARYATCPPITDDLPQTLTGRIDGTENLNYRAAIIDVPENPDAESLDITETYASQVNDNGDILLTDAEGNVTTIPTGVTSEMIAATEQTTYTWPVGSDWIESAWSVTTTVPSTITINVRPTGLGEGSDSKSALLILVADSRAGTPPDNVRFIDISALCGTETIFLPSTGAYIVPVN